MRLMKALCCAAALTAFVAPGARADEWNKLTYLTFSGPIQLPGVDNVPAGTYTFRLADAGSSRRVVQVLDKNTGKVYAMSTIHCSSASIVWRAGRGLGRCSCSSATAGTTRVAPPSTKC